jgi:hypothetical protein
MQDVQAAQNDGGVLSATPSPGKDLEIARRISLLG